MKKIKIKTNPSPGESDVKSMILLRFAHALVPLALPLGSIKHQVQSETDKNDLWFPDQTQKCFPFSSVMWSNGEDSVDAAGQTQSEKSRKGSLGAALARTFPIDSLVPPPPQVFVVTTQFSVGCVTLSWNQRTEFMLRKDGHKLKGGAYFSTPRSRLKIWLFSSRGYVRNDAVFVVRLCLWKDWLLMPLLSRIANSGVLPLQTQLPQWQEARVTWRSPIHSIVFNSLSQAPGWELMSTVSCESEASWAFQPSWAPGNCSPAHSTWSRSTTQVSLVNPQNHEN